MATGHDVVVVPASHAKRNPQRAHVRFTDEQEPDNPYRVQAQARGGGHPDTYVVTPYDSFDPLLKRLRDQCTPHGVRVDEVASVLPKHVQAHAQETVLKADATWEDARQDTTRLVNQVALLKLARDAAGLSDDPANRAEHVRALEAACSTKLNGQLADFRSMVDTCSVHLRDIVEREGELEEMAHNYHAHLKRMFSRTRDSTSYLTATLQVIEQIHDSEEQIRELGHERVDLMSQAFTDDVLGALGACRALLRDASLARENARAILEGIESLTGRMRDTSLQGSQRQAQYVHAILRCAMARLCMLLRDCGHSDAAMAVRLLITEDDTVATQQPGRPENAHARGARIARSLVDVLDRTLGLGVGGELGERLVRVRERARTAREATMAWRVLLSKVERSMLTNPHSQNLGKLARVELMVRDRVQSATATLRDMAQKAYELGQGGDTTGASDVPPGPVAGTQAAPATDGPTDAALKRWRDLLQRLAESAQARSDALGERSDGDTGMASEIRAQVRLVLRNEHQSVTKRVTALLSGAVAHSVEHQAKRRALDDRLRACRDAQDSQYDAVAALRSRLVSQTPQFATVVVDHVTTFRTLCAVRQMRRDIDNIAELEKVAATAIKRVVSWLSESG